MYKHVSLLAVAAFFGASSVALAQPQVNVDITPDEQAYQARTDARVRSWIHEQNHEATEEERGFLTQHWMRTARLWRIRKLAKDAGDNATVARVDALILRADSILEHQLEHMRAHAPVMQWAPGSVVVDQAPPPPQQEVMGTPPSPDQKWMPGHWRWNGARYFWEGGHWSAPPQPNMVFAPARWENRQNHWVYVDGRWNPNAVAPNVVYEPPPPPATVIEVQTAPPAPLVEVRPAGPANGVWIPGFWQWNGQRHVWVGGRWSAARAGMRWEPDHWVPAGRGWRMEHGRWAR
jgi:WXXGXW repeat (2 copies)